MRSIILLSIIVAFSSASPSWYYFGSSSSHHHKYGSHSSARRRHDQTIGEHLGSDKRFSKLLEAMEKNRGLRDDLDNKQKKMTFVAPTNEAFEVFEKLPEKPSIEWGDVLNYHIVENEKVDEDEFYDGYLLETRLKEDKLGGQRQRIRISRRLGRWFVNMYALVDRVENCVNGNIFVVDRILLPPPDTFSALYMMPIEFSTFTSASLGCNCQDKIKESEKTTVFAPSNEAWKSLGMRNLMYLFSPLGRDLLEQVIKYHIGTELRYVSDLRRGKETIKTLQGSTLTLQTETCRSPHHRHEIHHVLINGISRITFQDFPCENGVVHIINEVLVPREVREKLPEERWGGGQ